MNKKIRVTVRFDEDEYKILEEDEKKVSTKKNIGKYIRNVLFSKDKPIIIEDTKNKKNLHKLIGQVNKIGNNINQISYNLNIAKKRNGLSEVQYEELILKLANIENQLEVLQNDS